MKNTLANVRASVFLTTFSRAPVGASLRASLLASLLVSALASALAAGCSTSPPAAIRTSDTSARIGGVTAAERLRRAAPGRMLVEPVEGPADTAEFHIGSPLFLRLVVGDVDACAPGTGELFYFDATGAQLGWSFEEVVDTLLFPKVAQRCERVVMLSSDASNRLAEGRFTLRAQLFIDRKRQLSSDTIAVHPVRSSTGANEQSYARFLMEQIVRNPMHLRDPETVAALFGEGVPTSAESEVYRAVILYRIGDFAGATLALESSREMEQERRRALTMAASRTREALETVLGQMLRPNR